MEFKLDDPHVREMVQGAILNAISGEQRDKLITAAIQGLLDRDGGGKFKSVSNIEQIFEQQAVHVAQSYVQEKLKTDEQFRAALDEVLQKALDRFRKPENVEKIAERLESAMRIAITGERY